MSPGLPSLPLSIFHITAACSKTVYVRGCLVSLKRSQNLFFNTDVFTQKLVPFKQLGISPERLSISLWKQSKMQIDVLLARTILKYKADKDINLSQNFSHQKLERFINQGWNSLCPSKPQSHISLAQLYIIVTRCKVILTLTSHTLLPLMPNLGRKRNDTLVLLPKPKDEAPFTKLTVKRAVTFQPDALERWVQIILLIS